MNNEGNNNNNIFGVNMGGGQPSNSNQPTNDGIQLNSMDSLKQFQPLSGVANESVRPTIQPINSDVQNVGMPPLESIPTMNSEPAINPVPPMESLNTVNPMVENNNPSPVESVSAQPSTTNPIFNDFSTNNNVNSVPPMENSVSTSMETSISMSEPSVNNVNNNQMGQINPMNNNVDNSNDLPPIQSMLDNNVGMNQVPPMMNNANMNYNGNNQMNNMSQPLNNNFNNQQMPINGNNMNQPTNNPKPKKNKTLLIVIIILMVLIILGGLGFGAMMLLKNNNQKAQNNNENVENIEDYTEETESEQFTCSINPDDKTEIQDVFEYQGDQLVYISEYKNYSYVDDNEKTNIQQLIDADKTTYNEYGIELDIMDEESMMYTSFNTDLETFQKINSDIDLSSKETIKNYYETNGYTCQ